MELILFRGHYWTKVTHRFMMKNEIYKKIMPNYSLVVTLKSPTFIWSRSYALYELRWLLQVAARESFELSPRWLLQDSWRYTIWRTWFRCKAHHTDHWRPGLHGRHRNAKTISRQGRCLKPISTQVAFCCLSHVPNCAKHTNEFTSRWRRSWSPVARGTPSKRQ